MRFDGTLPRTSRSSMWMKSEAPTSLETELDLDGDSVAVAPALKSLRERIVYTMYNRDMAAAAHRELDGSTGTVIVCAAVKSLTACGHHSVIVSSTGHLREQPSYITDIKPRWPPPIENGRQVDISTG